jgi:HlyD family secretion protein
VIARAHVPQEVAALVKVGDVARITGIGDSSDVPGTVTVVGPALDPNSTTVEIRVESPNPGRRLRPGASVRLSVVVATEPNAIVIPVSALLTSDGASAVMVAGPDDHAHRRRVQVGFRQGNDAQIIAGLEPGERVVSVGAYGLQDGARVRVEPAARTP